MCIRHNYTLFSQTDTLQDRIGVDVEGNEGGHLDILKFFVTPPCADDELRVFISQHHVCAVIGNQPAQKIKQTLDHSFKTEAFGQNDVGIAQDFGLVMDCLFASE